ncbi:MAG: hypothetical protein LAO31_01560 [Acidobacteriia bacterium]|nr:hypothetical protein [Terriglobia bacterium]
MRKSTRVVFLILGAVMMFSVLGWADNNNGNGPVQTGFAIVTPSSSPAGVVVFETFGERDGNATTQAGVLPADMTTDALVFVRSNGRLSRNLGIAITNPNTASANVNLMLIQADGTTLTTKVLVVPGKSQVSQFVTELFASMPQVQTDFSGTVRITSDIPVAVVGLRFRGHNFSTLPVTSLSARSDVPSISAGVGGPGSVILPQFAAGGGWATEIVLVNSGSTDLIVRVDLFKNDGTALTASLNGQTASSFMNLTIPPGGVLVLAQRDNNGDDDF